MQTTNALISLVKGQEYEVVDWCGMFVKSGKYVGLFENKYISQKVFVFERTDDRTDERCRFMGAVIGFPHIKSDGVTFRLLARFYGPSIQELNCGGYHTDEWVEVQW